MADILLYATPVETNTDFPNTDMKQHGEGFFSPGVHSLWEVGFLTLIINHSSNFLSPRG
jgi:hypothetical protein